MSKNYLFSFIRKELLSSDNFKSFKLKISAKHNQEMLIHDLFSGLDSIVAKIGEVQLTLIEHHITLFDENKKDHSSQYHYTAKLKDQLGKSYNLHVYFDKNDKFTEAPNLTEGEQEIQAAFPELSAALGELAIDQTRVVVAELRLLHQNKLKQMQNRYADLETKLTEISSDIEGNRESYLVILDEAISQASQMCLYGNFNSLLRLLKRIKISLCTSSITKDIETTTNTEDEQEESIYEEENVPLKLKEKKTATTLVHEAQGCHTSYLKQKSERDKVKVVETFVLLHNKVQDILMLLDDQEFDFKKDDLVNIRILNSYINQEGKELLEQLLLGKLFELADKLKKLAPRLSTNILKLALMQNNARLLDFLLTNAGYAINTTTVDAIPLVLYCFLNHTVKTPKVACLSALIKHGASIMIQYQGLPLCFYIMEMDNNLNEAIYTNPAQTISNKDFYNCLIQNLENYLLMKSADLAKVELVKQALNKYRTKISFGSDSTYKNIFGARAIHKTETAAANLASRIDKNTSNEISTDPEIRSLYGRVIEVAKEYLLTLPNVKQRLLLNTGNDFINEIINKNPDKISADKNVIVLFYQTLIKLIELEIRLHFINSEVKKTQHSKKTMKDFSAEGKNLTKEKTKLRDQLRALMKEELPYSTQLIQSIDDDIAAIKKCQKSYNHIPEVAAFSAPDKCMAMNSLINNWPEIKAQLIGKPLSEEGIKNLEEYQKNMAEFADIYRKLSEIFDINNNNSPTPKYFEP
jgi:hypothetical protein